MKKEYELKTLDKETMDLYYVESDKINIVTLKEMRKKSKKEIIRIMDLMGIKTPLPKYYSKEDMLDILDDYVEENLEKIKSDIKETPILKNFNNVLFNKEHLLVKWFDYIKKIKEQRKQITIGTKENVKKIIFVYKTPKIKEFLIKNGLVPSKWKKLKANDEFKETIEYIETMEDVMTVNAIEKGYIDVKLASVLLGRFGYSQKMETKLDGGIELKAPEFHDIISNLFTKEDKKGE